MSAARPGEPAVATVRGGRLGWFGALLLCVLLGAAGVPVDGVGAVDVTRIEARDERGQRPGAAGVVAGAAELRAAGLTAVRAVPRSRPRALSIGEGGLPSPRAPSC